MGDPNDQLLPNTLEQDLIAGAEAPDGAEQIITTTMLKKAAALAATGTSRRDISKSLKVTVWYVNKMFRNDEFQRYLAEIGDDAISVAKIEMRTAVAKLTKKSIVALEKNLDKHSLEAVKVVLRAMGLDGTQKDDDAGKSSGLTLVLASQPKVPQTITVTQDKDKE